MRRPALSVLIDTYNHERYIEQAIVSAIEQDFPASEYEILVVDDGSTDRTPEIVRKFAPRVRLLRKKNGGQASAFNAGIPETRGEIVAFLDGDDWFAPGKISAVMQALEEYPDVAGVGHGYYDVNEQTHELKARIPRHHHLLHLATSEAAREARDSSSFGLMGALTARRSMLDRLTPIPEELIFCADAPVKWGLVASGGVLLLEQPLFYYRHHSDNLCEPGRLHLHHVHRRNQMLEAAYESTERLLERIGVSPECARALLYERWVECSREDLRVFGGARLKTLQTETRWFHYKHGSSSWGYHFIWHAAVGLAALLVPPRVFYRICDPRAYSSQWYRFLDITYGPRHAIGLNRRRPGTGAKAAH
jgi:glycosyltransferase involved in cell wall biosynthesis